MRKSLDQIRREGLVALRNRLGRAGMVRFLQQFEVGRGDYAIERHAWVDSVTLAELKKRSSMSRTQRKRAK